MTVGHKVDPIVYLTRNTKVMITNDRAMIDFIEFVLPNSEMERDGLINVEEQGKSNECVEILNQLYVGKQNNEMDKKKDNYDQNNRNSNNDNNEKYKDIVNWRSY